MNEPMIDEIFLDLDHVLLADHLVHGRARLPGLAYIDLIYQLAHDRGLDFRTHMLTGLTIYAPLEPEDGEDSVVLAVHWSPRAQGWDLSLQKKVPGQEALRVAGAQLHRVAAAEFAGPDWQAPDVPALTLAPAYARCRELGLGHGPAMRASGSVYLEQHQVLLDLVPESGTADECAQYMFHPALIDGAGIGAAALFGQLFEDDQALYLPVCYEAFHASALIQDGCCVRAQAASVTRRGEMVTVSLEFFDRAGTPIALLRNVMCKRVRDHATPAAASTQTAGNPLGGAGQTLVALLAGLLDMAPEAIDVDAGFYDLGLDSAAMLALTGQLAQILATDLPPTLLFEHVTVRALAQWMDSHHHAALAASRPAVETGTAAPGGADIAVIGIAGRYPGADDPVALWDNMVRGADSVTEVPEARWRWQDYTHIVSPSKRPVSRWGGFIDDPDCFDARFFRITPREAQVMDPQERQFLQTAWSAIEDAGYTPDTLAPAAPGRKGSAVGVFVGVMQKDYALIQAASASPGTTPLSANHAPIANRVSYVCNFSGPSLAVDTACSSSLVAVHLALQSLAQGECAVALAGGVNLSLHPGKYISCTLLDMHSSNGRCNSFGATGDGYVSAEGVGAVVLKPLARALADGDHIYGVIKASTSNHVGAVSGITVPSPVAQAELIGACLDKAGVDAASIGYVEAHGTGTALGDPIEIEGLTRAYRAHTAARQYCAIGSIKSNIGHAEGAAGISGLTKVLLQMQHSMLVPSLHAHVLNPLIAFAETPFVVQRTLQAWPQRLVDGDLVPRRAALSGFGASGTNVHLIVEQFSAPACAAVDTAGPYVVPLSASDSDSLMVYARRLHDAVARRMHAVSPPTVAVLAALLAEELGVEAAAIDLSLPLDAYTIDPFRREAFVARVASWPGAGDLAPALRGITMLTGMADAIAAAMPVPEAAIDLRAVALTLQVGRRALRQRAAFVARDLVQLLSQLDEFATQGSAAGGVFLGRAPVSAAATAAATTDLPTLAAGWVSGAAVDWRALHGDAPVARVSLPTYPFKRERYWVPQPEQAGLVLPAPANDVLRSLTTMLAGVTGMAPAQFGADMEIAEIGLDSLMIAALNEQLGAFGVADTTLFFRFRTLDELAGHLQAAHPQVWSMAHATAAPAGQGGNAAEPVPAATPAAPALADGAGDIAIVGLAGRYPHAGSLDEFWDNLCAGRDCVDEIPAGRWGLDGFYEPDADRAGKAGMSYSKWGAFLDGVDRFDPLFFNITPREAALMDPHERLFLETAWHCLEDAGYTRASLRVAAGAAGVGVFVGTTFNNYQLIMSEAAQRAGAANYAASSQVFSIANRVSYVLDCSGPSVTIDTACSSSLYALQMACDSLRSGQSSMAVAGGVNLTLHPSKYVSLSLGRFLASDGRCRAFSAGGAGYVPGEAVGAVLLRPLADAQRDGDHIYGVIKAAVATHGGRTNGYSVPSPAAQAGTITRALNQAGIAARSISCIEAHGTGTALGDPVEVAGLVEAFGTAGTSSFCAISSVKTNIGHSEAAAGIAQLTKVLLQMKHRMLVPNVMHGGAPNPNIALAGTPFRVQDALAGWAVPVVAGVPVPRRAGISSFGAGGANAHAIVEEYCAPARVTVRMPVLIVLSARDEERLRLLASGLAAAAAAGGREPPELIDLAYTLQVGREALAQRCAFQAETLADAVQTLLAIGAGASPPHVVFGRLAGLDRQAVVPHDVLADAVRAWPDHLRARELAAAWCGGAQPEWRNLYGTARPQRISLPGYPFARESYWIPGLPAGSARPAITVPATTGSVPDGADGVLLFAPCWRAHIGGAPVPAEARRLLILCEAAPAHVTACRAGLPHVRVEAMDLPGAAIDVRFGGYAARLMALIQEQCAERPGEGCLLQVVAPMAGEARALAGLAAMLRTAAQEHPALTVQWIGLDAWPAPDALVPLVEANRADPDATMVRHVDGRRDVLAWEEVQPGPDRATLRARGVFLITGGSGALALQLGLVIARQASDAIIVLAARSPAGPRQQSAMEAMRQLGAVVDYHLLDIADAPACAQLVQAIVAAYGALHGVIHCAGVVHDRLLANKTASELARVLAPKVTGLVNLDLATRAVALDFLVAYSSGAGAMGNVGQADYAAANAFMDAFMHHRAALRQRGQRYGLSCSINWPLWAEGGMRVDAGTIAAMRSRGGMLPLTGDEGARALFDCLALGLPQVLVASGALATLRALITTPPAPRRPAPMMRHAQPAAAHAGLAAATAARLVQLYAATTGLAETRIDLDEPLDRYGIDSVIIMQMNRELETAFDAISQTLFFEYKTLGALATHLAASRSAECLHWTGMNLTTEASIVNVNQENAAMSAPSAGQPAPATGAGAREPIAIIGLSGRYPQAPDLDAFWDNLKNGRDCITTIPPGRWPLEGFFEPSREAALRTGKSYSKWGGLIDDWDCFDPLFFNMSPLEAINLDPQARLFLETSWAVLEEAGYTRATLAQRHAGNVGVFAGVTKTGYCLHGPSVWPLNEGYNPQTSFSALANRVSYALDLHGPSVPVDTMCSSSLTAIHQACESIWTGVCPLAIAGGVNLYLHPSEYLELSGMQMLASDGRCKSFGAGADGFVPGEGAGAVLLKSLSAALADGDHIHGLIRATGINHGGKVNGFTVPNPVAQASLIRATLDRGGIDARSISYVEAHGTGTDLGDPIELSGLMQAFAADTADLGFCALGSVKSNIGHLEAAAGIVGLTKVLLQMKHGMRVPTLHADPVNPKLGLERSPFFLQHQAGHWPRPQPALDGTPTPRLATVSSFGAGGANAFVVVEEYVPPPGRADEAEPALIVLSARDQDRLGAQVAQLLRRVRNGGPDSLALAGMSRTLLTGREALEERVAIVASSLDDLEQKLAALLDEQGQLRPTGSAQTWRGRRADRQTALGFVTREAEFGEILAAWIARGKLDQLAQAWVNGADIDWTALYAGASPRRVSLPTYPFARERLQLPLPLPLPLPPAAIGAAAWLHPLLQKNTSSLAGLSFSAHFDGTEFFLAQHQVQGTPFFPAVAYLAMVDAARTQLGPLAGELRIADVVWARPATVGPGGLDLHLQLTPGDNGGLRFTIVSGTVAQPNAEHVTGMLLPSPVDVPAPLDLVALMQGCDSERDRAACYRLFDASGMQYGPAFRPLRHLHCGACTAIAHLEIDQASLAAWPDALHPGLLDAALQATAGLAGTGDGTSPMLPFALESFARFGARPDSICCVVRQAGGNERSRRLDIDLCDQHGAVWIAMRGYSARRFDDTGKAAAVSGPGLLRLVPEWRADGAPSDAGWDCEQHLVLLAQPHALPPALAREYAITLLPSVAQDGSAAQRFGALLQLLLAETTALLKHGPLRRTLLQVVLPPSAAAAPLAGLNGFLRTLMMEAPAIRTQLIILPAQNDARALLACLQENRALSRDMAIRYEAGSRSVAAWKALPEPAAAPAPVWSDGEVYLITGGAGGLGLLLANDIATHAPGARIVLVGRSALSGETLAAVTRLQVRGVAVDYLAADCADRDQVGQLVTEVVRRHGRLDGLVHAAGVTRDSFLRFKSASDCAQVLAAKVDSIVHLDAATRHLTLRFIVLFASLAGQTGNAGQADYAAANGFLDGFARYRNVLADAGERHGRTVSIDWPLWCEGGMRIDAATQEVLLEDVGLAPLDTATGLRLFHEAVGAGTEQLMVVCGDLARLRPVFLGMAGSGDVASAGLEEQLCGILAELLSVARSAIDVQLPLGDFGLDAPLLQRFWQRLVEALPDSPVLAAGNTGLLAGGAISLAELAGRLADRAAAPAAGAPGADLHAQALALLTAVIGRVIKLPPERLHPDRDIEQYGIDSVMVTQITAQLEKTFGTLSKTLFFEYATVRAVAAHLANEHGAVLRALHAPALPAVAPPAAVPVAAAATAVPVPLPAATVPVAAAAGRASGQVPLDIAIIGVAGRYAMAADLDQFWDNLREGKDCVGEIPATRWDYGASFDPAKGVAGKTYCKWGGFLDNVASFDAAFFNISPREAQIMDPQERLFLETVYHTLEDAGYTRESISTSRAVGVYVGVMYEEYQFYGVELTADGAPVALTGNPAAIANRVSYFCNFRGPSMAVDTMCSSSLTSLHLACQSLALGECEVAVAGGVNLSLHPNKYLMLSQGRFASSSGKCASFGEGGDGYVPGEGVGAVLLKPLEQALRDGDHVYGVIKATAINHGGKSNGYTVPNPNAQAEVIAKAIASAGIAVDSIGYVEAHGTGTALGDPIEIAGLTRAFAAHTAERGFCAIGSVKSNIGHCESAAGIAGLTKILLQMRHRQLVPSLHAMPLNHNIVFEDTPFVVQRSLAPWQPLPRPEPGAGDYPLRASMSSFGAGGANAHVIIEACPRPGPARSAGAVQLIVLSARKADQLEDQVRRLHRHLVRARHSDADLAAIAWTLQAGREAMEERLCIVARTIGDLRATLEALLAGRTDLPDVIRARAGEAGAMLDGSELAALMAAGDLMPVASAWAGGRPVAWLGCHEARGLQRVSLPGYAFARTEYWVPSIEQLGRSSARQLPPTLAPEAAVQSTPPVSVPSAQPLPVPAPAGRQRLLVLNAAAGTVPHGGVARARPRGSVVLANMHAAPAVTRETITPAPASPTAHVSLSLTTRLGELLAEALYMDPGEIDSDLPFVDMGLDSIIGLEWVNAVNQAFNLSIGATKVYDYPTLAQFAQLVASLQEGPGEAPVVPPALAVTPLVLATGPVLLQQELATELAAALFADVADMDPDTAFTDLGLDSVLGIEWLYAINQKYGIALTAADIYDHPTLHQFSRLVTARLQGALPEALPVPVAPPAAQVLSLDEVLERVASGLLDLEEASALLA